MEKVPSYEELPYLGDLGVRHAWDVWPQSIGTFARLQPDLIVEAATLVHEGVTVPLNLAVDAFDPPLFGRQQVTYRVVETTKVDAEDVLDDFNPQSSSQLDGLGHVRAKEYGYFGGTRDLEKAREQLGIHHIARRGIATRGVLLDLASRDAADGAASDDGRMYDAALLDEVAAAQGVEIRPGDVLLVRTGWVADHLAVDPAKRETPHAWNGLKADEEMAGWLWDRGIVAVGTDNPSVECAPGAREIGSLHRRLLPALGMSMLELLDLERLHRECRRLGRWDFFFVAVPLHLPGGVSSPSNAMALL